MVDDYYVRENKAQTLIPTKLPLIREVHGASYDLDLSFVIHTLQEYNKKLPASRKRTAEDYLFLEQFYRNFIEDRNRHAEEISSQQYKNVLDIAANVFPYKVFFLMCAGGRNDPLYALGAPSGIIERLRIPERFLREFGRNENGELELLDDSYITTLLEDILSNTNNIAFIVDSHLRCSARRLEEIERGENPSDHGLYIDIQQKGEIIDALKRYIQSHFPTKKTYFIQTSFNPITGFMYMGLETQNSFIYSAGIARGKAEIHGKNPNKAHAEYSEDVLDFLINREVVVSTAQIVKDPQIKELFEQSYFQIDWKNKYADSAKLFWEKIATMKQKALPLISSKLSRLYPASDENHIRAMTLLLNAFNGYLHNPDQVSPIHNDDDNIRNYENEYNTHQEQGILLATKDVCPHNIPMVVIPDDKQLHRMLERGILMVRKNRTRETNPIFDITNTYKTADNLDFIKAPVPIVVQEFVDDALLSAQDWELLDTLSWTDLPYSAWESLTDKQFSKYLEEKGEHLPLSVANGIMELRRRMRKVYTPGTNLLVDITEQTVIILPILTDTFGRTHRIIPFLKFGN